MKESESGKVKFTIIIPTRERCDTLESALETCVSQDYGNLEIIVSDNFSQDRTKEVVDSFKDNRIRCINPGKRVSMSDNWEFALSHVHSGYVMYLGDDDGILPGALTELNEIINETHSEAISWKSAGYCWPECISENSGNMLTIPLKDSLIKRNSKEMLKEVAGFRMCYYELPMLYRGLVSYSAIKRASESGRFFHSMIPDVYSGIAIACITETYYYSSKPYTIEGISHHSTGAAIFNAADKKSEKKFLSEENIPFHSRMVYAPSMPILVAESLLQAHDHISSAKRFEIDMKGVISAAVGYAVTAPESQYNLVIGAVKEIAKINGVEEYVSQVIAANKNVPLRAVKPVPGVNIFLGQVLINCSKFGVCNVYEASLLCRHVIAMRKAGYFSLGHITMTTFGLIKREIQKRSGLPPFSLIKSFGIIRRILLKR